MLRKLPPRQQPAGLRKIFWIQPMAGSTWRRMAIEDFPEIIRRNYEIREWRHASAILQTDFPNEYRDLCEVLGGFSIGKSQLLSRGGRKTDIAGWIDTQFYARGWKEKHFDTKIVVDATELQSPTHKVDCFRNRVALEVEWNNNDPFFDRDLNNFRLLFELRAVSIGIVVTRSDELQGVFRELRIGDKYGASTTHWGKLLPRIEGGGGGGCPILAFGIRRSLYDESR